MLSVWKFLVDACHSAFLGSACLGLAFLVLGQGELRAEALPPTRQAPAQQDDETDQEATENDDLTLDEIFAGELPKSIEDLKAFESHVKDLVKRLKPATVGIQMANAQGSGVIISPDGFVLTAAHVIQKPGQICDVQLPDGTTAKAKTLGMHHPLDYGLLKLVDDDTNWPYLDMGESASLKNGQWVVAIGHPGGFDGLRGPVVRVGRIRQHTNEILQTDCTLVGGDSGGPLFDMDGYIIGIHSKIGASLANNMHVPVDLYSQNWDTLESGKEVGRKEVRLRAVSSRILGFSFSSLRGRIRVTRVSEGSAAEAAGMQRGDLILKVAGEAVKSRSEVEDAITASYDEAPGDPISITVDREGEQRVFEIRPPR